MKEKVSEFQLEVGNSVWDAIEEQIDDQGGKRRGVAAWWWLFSGLFFASFLYLALNVFFSNDTPVNPIRFASSKKKTFVKSSDPKQMQDRFLSTESRAESKVESAPRVINQSTVTPFKAKSLIKERLEKGEIFSSSTHIQPVKNELIHSDDRKTVVPNEIPKVKSARDSIAELPNISQGNGSNSLSEDKNERNITSNGKWSVMAYAGPGISYRTLKGQNAQGIVDHRNSHEKRTFTYDAGISGQLNLKRSSYLRFGLSYSRYAEKYDFHHNAISHSTKNTYGYGQLNINYGEKLASFDSGELSFFGGLGVGHLLHAQSSWIDPNALVPVVHSNTQANQPFENWIFNFRFGVDYQMRFSEQLELHIIPGMEGLINSSYKKETQLNQHPYAFNLNVGVSYNF